MRWPYCVYKSLGTEDLKESITTNMNTMDMTSSPVLTRSVLEPYNPVIQDPTQSPLVDLHPFMISQALFIAETYRLLPEIYELLWQTLYKLESQGQMARQSPPAATHNSRRRGPPSPDPEPAAPPVIILSQSGTRRVPRFQVPAADGGVDQGPHPQPQKPTSSPSQQFPPRPPRYHLRSHSRNNNSRAGGIATSNPPNKPPPEPHPAPPVIILSTNTATSPPPARPASTPTLTPTPAFPASAPAPAPAHTPNQPSASSPTPPLPNTMGSKVSKLKEKSAEGKLQPSQARQDKEEMKEPSNYYTTRSKSMRKKAAKGAPDAAPGLP